MKKRKKTLERNRLIDELQLGNVGRRLDGKLFDRILSKGRHRYFLVI